MLHLEREKSEDEKGYYSRDKAQRRRKILKDEEGGGRPEGRSRSGASSPRGAPGDEARAAAGAQAEGHRALEAPAR